MVFIVKKGLQNPIAESVANNSTTSESTESLKYCGRLYVSPEDKVALEKYFNAVKESETALGKFYRDEIKTVDNLIKRLAEKRYLVAYLNGQYLEPREKNDVLDRHIPSGYSDVMQKAEMIRKLFERIGTDDDTDEIYREYITLDEMAVSGMVLICKTDIVVGRGSRGPRCYDQDTWNQIKSDFFKEQSENTATAAVYSYPSGIEYRGFTSASLDSVFTIVSNEENTEFTRRVNRVKKGEFFDNTLYGLYGSQSALDFTFDEARAAFRSKDNNDWIKLDPFDGKERYLYKPAYYYKTKRILTQIILANDLQMRELGLGKVLNLKGLGLGAFGLGDDDNTKLREIFYKALRDAFKELSGELSYISRINLINEPYQYFPELPSKLEELDKDGNIVLSKNCMDALTRYVVPKGDPNYGNKEYEVGATVFCGDSASMPGNEAWLGSPAFSSDDPATLYSMAHPLDIIDFLTAPNPVNEVGKGLEETRNEIIRAAGLSSTARRQPN